MFNIGDIIISRYDIKETTKSSIIKSSEYGYSLFLTKHKTYILNNKFYAFGTTWFEFIDDKNITTHFSLQQFENFFLPKIEIRKLKLETLNNKKC